MVTAMTKGPFDGLSSTNPVFGNGSGFSAGGRFDLSCQYAPANVGIGGESRVVIKTELGNSNVNDKVENVGGITFNGVNNIRCIINGTRLRGGQLLVEFSLPQKKNCV